ncbi:MAG: ParA family protein [Oscillospiraceae bacterium]|jgi:chromosome partitioning protein|nr:ParA family protein [Oscillospiraceae bacterium]
MTNITGFISGRGGASKSTSSQALHTWLNTHNHKALLIDFDQQGNTSYTYGLEVSNLPTMYHVFNNDIDIKNAINHTRNGDIINGNASLNKIEALYNADNYLEGVPKLREKLHEAGENYSHIIIDTAPKIQGMMATQVLVASTSIVVPISPDIYSIQGLARISQVIAPIKAGYNPDLRIDGVLLTKYNDRLVLNASLKQAVEQWAAQNDTRIYAKPIRESVAVREAQAKRDSLWDYASESNPSLDYQAFIAEYLERNA